MRKTKHTKKQKTKCPVCGGLIKGTKNMFVPSLLIFGLIKVLDWVAFAENIEPAIGSVEICHKCSRILSKIMEMSNEPRKVKS